jgi:RHS repeat-associated protein
MMPAAKHLDPVLGIDIHIIQPPGPVPPVPIPHPFVGILFDPMDYVPILGATVLVNGIPRAIAGTEGKGVPPHIPIGGVFVKPPIGNECEMFMGSSTVCLDGDAASYTALPALSCQCIGVPAPFRAKKKGGGVKSLKLPTSVVLPIPAGRPVLIGGAPTISLMAIGMKIGMAILGRLAKGLRRLQKASRRWRALSRRLRKAASKLLDKLGISKASKWRNRINRAICWVTGHPVDIATGKVFTEMVDFTLPGPIPFKWERVWFSTSTYQGPLGYGWHHNYDFGLIVDDQAKVVAVRLVDGRSAVFPKLEIGQTAFDRKERLTLFLDKQGYALRTAEQLIYRFGVVGRANGEQAVLTIKNLMGDNIQFYYDQHGHLIQIQDCAERLIEIVSDPNGLIKNITLPHPEDSTKRVTIVSYQYDKQGNLIKVSDALNHPATFCYQQHLLVQETNRNGLSFYFEYDGTDEHAKCIRTWGDGGIYDHKLTYEPGITVVENSLGHKSIYHVNELGLVIKEIDPQGHEKTFEFDEEAYKLVETDALGQKTTYQYDAAGNRTETTWPDGSQVKVKFDELNNPIELIDASGASWIRHYDPQGRLVKQIDPLGRPTTYYYQGSQLSGVQDAADSFTAIQYDQSYNLTRLRLPNGGEIKWRYDLWGRITSVTDPKNQVQQRYHDLLDQLYRIEEADGQVRELTYDAEGNVLRDKDAAGRVTQYQYESLRQIKRRIDPLGHILEYQYDTERNLIGLINEKQEQYQLKYDENEQLIEEIGFDGRIQHYEYNAIGHLLRHIDSSRFTEFKRDPLGRLVEKKATDGETTVVNHYAYDALGRLTEAKNDARAVKFEYDAVGNLVSEHQDQAILQHVYDVVNNRIRTILPDQQTLDYAYDRNGFYTHLDLNTQRLTQLQRDIAGREIRRQQGELTSEFSYDPMGRLQQQRVGYAYVRQAVIQRNYGYDQTGNLTLIDDLHKGKTQFHYDALDRLSQVTGLQNEILVFDPASNILSYDQTHASYDLGHRLKFFGDRHFEYDATGNLIKEKRGKGGSLVTEYRYDPQNQLVEVKKPDNQIVYQYDALGRRISKQDAFGKTEFLWNGDVLLSETRRHLHKLYLYEPDSFKPLAFVQDKRVYYYHLDHLGTPQEMTDANGKIVWNVRYRAYGNVVEKEVERVENNLRFQGQYFDAETGLHYNRFRYYDPQVGQFVQQDPIRLLGEENFYQYTINPITWIDPLGLAQGKGERNYAGSSQGTSNPFKHMTPHPTDPTKVLVKDSQTGKTITKAKPDGFDEYWASKTKGRGKKGGCK